MSAHEHKLKRLAQIQCEMGHLLRERDRLLDGMSWQEIAPFNRPQAVRMVMTESGCRLREAYDRVFAYMRTTESQEVGS